MNNPVHTVSDKRLRSESVPDPVRTARAGLVQFNADHHRYPSIDAAVAKMERDLDQFIGANVTPAKTMLAASAVALFAGVLLVRSKLLSARGRTDRIGTLLEQLPNVVGCLQRTLRALGATGATESDADEPATGGLAEWTARWQARQRANADAPSEPEVES